MFNFSCVGFSSVLSKKYRAVCQNCSLLHLTFASLKRSTPFFPILLLLGLSRQGYWSKIWCFLAFSHCIMSSQVQLPKWTGRGKVGSFIPGLQDAQGLVIWGLGHSSCVLAYHRHCSPWRSQTLEGIMLTSAHFKHLFPSTVKLYTIHIGRHQVYIVFCKVGTVHSIL